MSFLVTHSDTSFPLNWNYAANSDKPKGEGLQQQENVQVKVSKKKKAKVAQPDALKTKIKRSGNFPFLQALGTRIFLPDYWFEGSVVLT